MNEANFIMPPVPTLVERLRQCEADLERLSAAEPQSDACRTALDHVRNAIAVLEPLAGSTS